MQKITFECKIITPMFLAGADGETPELRPPSIKGALRFWWRACNGHLVERNQNGDWDYTKLKEYEGKIFGDTNRKSETIIQIIKPPPKTSREEMLPHKLNERHRSPRDCFPAGETFMIRLAMRTSIKLDDSSNFEIEQLKNLFILVSVLGGLGKRSRRGYGSFEITHIDEKEYSTPGNTPDIRNLINNVNPLFTFTLTAAHPIIQSIDIGTAPKTPADIGSATHDEKVVNRISEYKATIGAGKPRFASPIYISFLPSNKPIITTLLTNSPARYPSDINYSIQTNLKRRIL